MSDQLKYIIQELNKAPFHKDFSVVTFDALGEKHLIKILTDVFLEIDKQQNVDVDLEEPEETAAWIFNLLRIFKYPPASDQPERVKEGLIESSKSVIHPILEWLLQRVPDLHKRAYLARYLVKLDVPQDMLADPEVNNVYQQYLALIEQFKDVHKQCEQLRQADRASTEVKRDISNMEEEKKQLTKRVGRMKKKVENYPNVETMLASARSLRQEREREDALNNQKQEQHTAMQRAEQKLQRLNQEVRGLNQAKAEATPEALLQRCEQDVKVNTYIVKVKLPKEIKAREKHVHILEKVARHPDVNQAELDKIHAQVQAVQNEVSKLVEKRMMANEPMDDKLSMFRQQAAIIARKKESTAETIEELRSKLSGLEAQVKHKREQLSELGGVEILKGDEFKHYVTKLRAKSNTYKRNKQEQSELKAELGVLARTEEILKQKTENVGRNMDGLEAEHSISGLRDTHNEPENVSSQMVEGADEDALSLSDMSGMVTKMKREINMKKSALAPMIKELRLFRQQCQDMSSDYEESKGVYNSVAAGLEANISKLEREVRNLEDKHNNQESRSYLSKLQIEILKVQHEQANAELRIYLSGDASAKKQSLREQYNQCILEQEKVSKSLKEEQKVVRDSYQAKTKQMQMWKDLQRLMECKRKNGNRENNSAGSYTRRMSTTS